MSRIDEYLRQIMQAVYGKDVRKAIHDGIKACYEDNASSPENVEAIVTGWLEDHPEATTTVEDGSITEDKLNSDLYSAYASTGANLFNPNLSSITVNGLTYTFDEEEKTYHIIGTANVNTYIPIGFVTLDAGQYKLVGLTEQGSSGTFRLNLYNNVSGSLIAQDIGNGAVFTLSERTVCKITPYINGGVTVDTTIKVMITTYTHATIDDYAPYLYGENRLDLNVGKLKYDLYKTKLTGNKINNYDTGWVYDIAQNWIDNASNIFYGYDNNLFWDITSQTEGKYPLTCSVFVASIIFGISYNNSKYNNLASNVPNLYGYKDDTLIENLRSTFDSGNMLSYFIEKGYAFVPASNLEDIHTGDILYYNSSDSDDITSDNFMGVDHSAIYAYRVSSTRYAVWEVGDDTGPKLVTLTHSSRNLVMAVRVPYNAIAESKRRITLSTQQFAGGVALTLLFDFKRNNTFNIWKVSILGKVYAEGASSSSIYLIRTNASGAINEAVPLFEGTNETVRKLDSSYNVVDASGNYNQAVTIVVEWIG